MFRKFAPRNVKIKYLVAAFIVFYMMYFLGILTHLFEKNFYSDFHYPYDGDVEEEIYLLKNGKSPKLKAINTYDYIFVINNEKKCVSEEQQIRVVFLIKSAPQNLNQRSAIRSTWGYEKRFSDVEMRRLFLLGIPEDITLQNIVDDEARKYKDIIQANFTDHYFNNTIKTMIGLKWTVKYCSKAQFYMLVDDDYYVSAKNLLRFLRNPTNYPRYLQDSLSSLKNVLIKREIVEYELPDDVKLYSGYVFNSSPHRHFFSKWYTTLEEYPYHMWPPYVTAGAVVLSREAILGMYYASFYTKHFRFDDIYLGLLALKAKIEPYHSSDFHFYKQNYDKDEYQFTVASHGFKPMEMISAWNEQKALGNA